MSRITLISKKGIHPYVGRDEIRTVVDKPAKIRRKNEFDDDVEESIRSPQMNSSVRKFVVSVCYKTVR